MLPVFSLQFQAPGFIFWKFVSLADSDAAVTLGKLSCLSKLPDCETVVASMLQAQVAAVHELIFDRLRSPGSLDFIKANFPLWYKTEDFMNDKKWTLDLPMGEWGSWVVTHLGAMFLQPRCPPPGLDAAAMTPYKYELGLSAVLLTDLQRIYACLQISQDEASWQVDYLGKVCLATTAFSTKVVTPMSTQGEWRHVCCVSCCSVSPALVIAQDPLAKASELQQERFDGQRSHYPSGEVCQDHGRLGGRRQGWAGSRQCFGPRDGLFQELHGMRTLKTDFSRSPAASSATSQQLLTNLADSNEKVRAWVHEVLCPDAAGILAGIVEHADKQIENTFEKIVTDGARVYSTLSPQTFAPEMSQEFLLLATCPSLQFLDGSMGELWTDR